MKNQILSKSTFMYGKQCQLRLYLHKFFPQLKQPKNEYDEDKYLNGTKVGLLAQQYFEGAVDATLTQTLNMFEAVKHTSELIKNGIKIIYEASFMFDDVFCAVDILVNENGKWNAYEVKSVNNIKPQYEIDAALQYFLITNSGIVLNDFFIMHLNKDYIKIGDLNIKQLFTSISVLDKVIKHQSDIKQKIIEFKSILNLKTEPSITVGKQCNKPYICDFFNHCHKYTKKIAKNKKEEVIDIPSIKTFISEIKYPVYYFDFETVSFPIPIYNQSRPYQQLPFQYSLHIQQSKDALVTHTYFLGDGNDQREALLEKLISDLNTNGSILVWYERFEKSRLKEMAIDFPQYKKQIDLILIRIIDLMIPFKKMYSHPDFNGSASIKDVLPVLIPELTYKNLQIQHGLMASSVYAKLNKLNDIEKQESRKQLLDYCELDTLALVKILSKLNEL